MNLNPPKLPLPDDPVEAFFFTLLVIDDIAMFTLVFPRFSTQPLAKTVDELFWSGVLFLMQLIFVLVTKYDWPGMDD